MIFTKKRIIIANYPIKSYFSASFDVGFIQIGYSSKT